MKKPAVLAIAPLILLTVNTCAYRDGGVRGNLPPFTDGISHTSGQQGRWVKGCPPTPCNMGVGNLGPANTYHWE